MAKKGTKNKDLFEDQDVMAGNEILLMYDISGKKSYGGVLYEIDRNFTMDELRNITGLVRQLLDRYKICNAEQPDTMIDGMRTSAGFKYKKDYEHYLTYVLGCKENFRTFFWLLDEPTRKMFEYLFVHGYASTKELEKVTGRKWFSMPSRYDYWGNGVTSLDPASCFASVERQGYYSTSQYYIRLHSFFWRLYKSYILTVENSCDGQEEMPEGKWKTYTNEAGIGSQMQVIGQLLQQNAIEFSDKKMTASVVKNIDKQLNVPEFFTDATDKSQKYLSASLVIPILSSLLFHYSESLTEYHRVLKFFFSKYSMRYVLFDMLSHLKGMKRNDVIDLAYYDEHEKLLQCSLKTNKIGKWYSFDEIKSGMYACKDAQLAHLIVFPARLAEGGSILKPDGKSLDPSDYYKYVQCPVTCGYLALYAACGLLEVAYTDNKGVGAYSFVKYVRLTKLGAFVLGLTASYEAEGMHKPKEYFEADSDRLIIVSRQIDGKNPYEGLLTNIAEKISENRWVVTPKTWLGGCTSVNDLIAKQDFFKENVCSEPLEVWSRFFARMIDRCNPLRIPKEQYSVRQIDSSNKELLQLFLTDSYLRKHTIRGENFTILIEKGYLKKVEEKLREYGYLV